MSEFETKDGMLDISRLEMALQELESGRLDEAERDDLMVLITRSPAAQRAYLGYFEVSAMLVAESATHVDGAIIRAAVPLLPIRWKPPSNTQERKP